MERLTDKRMKGEGFIPVDHKEYKVILREEKPTAKQIYRRLLEIEDILGDEYNLDRLQELAEADRDGRYIIMKYPEQDGVKRLRELAEADRDGRCVVLPCKLHDKVFFIENGCVKETEVDSFHKWTSGRWKISTHTDRMYDHWKGYEIDFSGIGKTVFLTREDAEAALKGERDG